MTLHVTTIHCIHKDELPNNTDCIGVATLNNSFVLKYREIKISKARPPTVE